MKGELRKINSAWHSKRRLYILSVHQVAPCFHVLILLNTCPTKLSPGAFPFHLMTVLFSFSVGFSFAHEHVQ